MGPVSLYFDYRDLFKSLRLALSGKKIWIFISGNVTGYIFYWIFSYVAIILSGETFNDALTKYGLYPYLEISTSDWPSQLIYFLGLFTLIISFLLSNTAVSRVTYRQLKGDDFYSPKDSYNYLHKHWHPVLFAPIAILFIIFVFVVFASFFALIGSIPVFGEFLFSFAYIIYFFGALFTFYTFFVLAVCLMFTPAIVSVCEEDTMGAVFHSYATTTSQPWRLILYHTMLIPLLLIGLVVMSWFWMNTVGFIDFIFGHDWFMAEKFSKISNYAFRLIFPDIISDVFVLLKEQLWSIFGFNLYFPTLFPLDFKSSADSLKIFDIAGGTILSLSYFLLVLSVISYGFSIISVGQTIMFIIFKKLSDDENLLLGEDEFPENYNVGMDIDKKVELKSEREEALS